VRISVHQGEETNPINVDERSRITPGKSRNRLRHPDNISGYGRNEQPDAPAETFGEASNCMRAVVLKEIVRVRRPDTGEKPAQKEPVCERIDEKKEGSERMEARSVMFVPFKCIRSAASIRSLSLFLFINSFAYRFLLSRFLSRYLDADPHDLL